MTRPLTTAEAAEMVNCSPQTIARHAEPRPTLPLRRAWACASERSEVR